METCMNIMEHMKNRHPNEKNFGDVVIKDCFGRVKSEKCQICGEELVRKIDVFYEKHE